MKKIFLTAIALLSMASATVFGSYGVGDWITFLTDGNRFEARMDQLGFTLGNDTIKGTFGFHNDGRGTWGGMLSHTGTGDYYNFTPTISMGLGYTSSLISIGVGYNATIGPRWDKYNGKATSKKTEAVVHTPVLVLNAMDNAFRMAIPIQVLNLADKYEDGDKSSVTAVSLDAQFRYYPGLEVLQQIRLYIKYGGYWNETTLSGTKEKNKYAESFGFDLRFYFGSMVEEVALQPIVKLAYNGAVGKQHNQTGVTALGVLDTITTTPTYTSTYGTSAWKIQLKPALGLTANSDIVSLYLEPALGLNINQAGGAEKNLKEVYSLGWDAYAEIYITPLKNLEWYFEASVSGDSASGSSAQPAVSFAGTTGITWYLPAL